MRYNQSHKEKIIPQMKLHLTIMPVNFTCLLLAVKNLYLYEKQLKAMLSFSSYQHTYSLMQLTSHCMKNVGKDS